MNLPQFTRRFAAWTVAWLLVCAAFAPGGILLNDAVGNAELTWRVIIHYCLTYLPWILFSQLAVRSQLWLTSRPNRWKSFAAIQLALWLGCSLLHTALLVAADVSSLHLYAKSGTAARSLMLTVFLLIAPMDALIQAAIVGIARAWRSLKSERHKERALMDARLHALQTRLQPHFLFNVLNAIAELVHVDPNKADIAITQLSRLLRRVAYQEARTHSLIQEFGLIDDYLGVQEVLLESRLRVVRRIEKAALGASVPVMILQPLVENAIQHGISRSKNGGILTLEATLTDSKICLSVIDECVTDTPPSPSNRLEERDLRVAGSERQGLGLELVRKRLDAVFGKSATLQLNLDLLGRTSARIEIPIG